MKILKPLLLLVFIVSCSKNDEYIPTDQDTLALTFGDNINMSQLEAYKNMNVPDYIRYGERGNDIDDAKATLGRVLFYDKKLSINNTIACASCHHQDKAFSDSDVASTGVNGTTKRHSMRLINVAFQEGQNYFWNERRFTLENQVITPIKDHVEMGFSGEEGGLEFSLLIDKLNTTDYYPILFQKVYNNPEVTEEKMIEALAHFVRSIQSFDSKYDAGIQLTGNVNGPFPNFSDQENRGAFLFNNLRENGGIGCVNCHAAPEFAIKNMIHNNGVIATINDPNVFDHGNTRSPSLRDLTNPNGELNTPLMHNGSMNSLLEMINHYNNISFENQQLLDPLLFETIGPEGPVGQNLNLTESDKLALIEFFKTLSGNDVYTNPKWSDPFLNN